MDAAMTRVTQALPEVVCVFAATFMLCILFHALMDPEVRLCVLGTRPPPHRREPRRKSSPEAAMRQRGGEGGPRKSSPEAAMRKKSSPEGGPRKSSPEATAARREGAVPRAQRAPPRQDDLGTCAPAPPKPRQDDRRTCAPGTRVAETSSTSQARGSARRRGGGEEPMGPAAGRSGRYDLATIMQSREAICPGASRVVRSGVFASSSRSPAAPVGPTSRESSGLSLGGSGLLHTGTVEEPAPLSEEVIRMIVKPLLLPQEHGSGRVHHPKNFAKGPPSL